MRGWTVTVGAISFAPIIHGWVPCEMTYSFASPRIRGVGWWRLGRSLGCGLRRFLGRRRWLCRRRRGHTSVTFGNPDVSAVNEGLLWSFAHSTVARPIAAPVVAHSPPPLNHAVITCQAAGQLQLDLEYVISMRVYVPLRFAIRLFQYILQLLLGNGRSSDLSHTEREVSLMVGGNIYDDFNLLSLFVRLGDGFCSVLSWVDVFGLFQMVGVSAHPTLAFVGGPLHIEPATVQLVVRVLPRCVKAVSPSRVPAGWVDKSSMTQN